MLAEIVAVALGLCSVGCLTAHVVLKRGRLGQCEYHIGPVTLDDTIDVVPLVSSTYIPPHDRYLVAFHRSIAIMHRQYNPISIVSGSKHSAISIPVTGYTDYEPEVTESINWYANKHIKVGTVDALLGENTKFIWKCTPKSNRRVFVSPRMPLSDLIVSREVRKHLKLMREFRIIETAHVVGDPALVVTKRCPTTGVLQVDKFYSGVTGNVVRGFGAIGVITALCGIGLYAWKKKTDKEHDRLRNDYYNSL